MVIEPFRLTLHKLAQTILLRDALMFFRQSSKPESRPAIDELIEATDTYLASHLRSK